MNTLAHNTPTNDLHNALAVIFSSSARIDVLRTFMLDPTRAYYQRQLEAATGLPIRAIQRELERMDSVGLLYRRKEGNRTYFQVDQDFPLFPDLRSMVMKAAQPGERFRGLLALDEGARLAFLDADQAQALVVEVPGKRCTTPPPEGIAAQHWSSEQFIQALSAGDTALAPFLNTGTDILGRRDDVIWRHIEAAGYNVSKGDGVP